MRKNGWTNHETSILVVSRNKDTSELQKLLPQRKRTAIIARLHKLRLVRNKNENLRILLDETHISYYWIGYLLADGHFSKNNRLQLCISIRDKSHAMNLYNFLKMKTKIFETKQMSMGKIRDYIRIAVMNKEFISLIKQKFDISNNKTYNPPKVKVLEKLNKELLTSLFIGFIDGDGHIWQKNRQSSIRIEGYKTWLDIFLFFRKLFLDMSYTFIKPKINNDGLAYLICNNNAMISFLKRHITKHKLPVLSRKWDKIDEIYKNRKLILSEDIEMAKKLRQNNLSYKKIANIMKISFSKAYRLINNQFCAVKRNGIIEMQTNKQWYEM